ncbi:MAG TPA: hypothetical protein V6C63_17460 [Allocoleopsis sp.]
MLRCGHGLAPIHSEGKNAIYLPFNQSIRQRQGAIADVKDVFQSLQIEASGTFDTIYSRAKEIITIQTTTQRYSFGLGLSSVGCLWIAQEIKSWLGMERS